MAPKGMKRPAASSMGRPLGRPPKNARHGAGDCKLVHAALLDTALGPMLGSVVDQTLGVYSDQRHKFQTQFVQMIGEALSARKEVLTKALEAAKAIVDGSETERNNREQALADAEADLKAKEEASTTADETLEKESERLISASSAMKEAETNQKNGDSALEETKQLQVDVESAVEKMGKMKEAVGDATDVKEVVKVVRSLSDESDSEVAAYLPDTLGKEPSARGQFDAIVMKETEEALAKKLDEVTKTLAGASESKAARAAAVESASSAFTDATEKKQAAKTAQKEAADAWKVATRTLKEAKAAVANFESSKKSHARDLASAQEELEKFTEGALASYENLKDKATPPPEPEPEEPEEPAEEPQEVPVDAPAENEAVA